MQRLNASTINMFCLFVTRENFYSYGDVTITSEGPQSFTYSRYSWPFNSENFLTCHSYCDTGHPFIMVISEETEDCLNQKSSSFVNIYKGFGWDFFIYNRFVVLLCWYNFTSIIQNFQRWKCSLPRQVYKRFYI